MLQQKNTRCVLFLSYILFLIITQALNGPDKGWKNEPVHKSPLWYNVPSTKPPKKKVKTEEAPPAVEGDSQPLDFDTFVPTHDASLPELGAEYSAPLPPEVPVASRDEAFTRALGAMYWVGYWTAVYHVRGPSHEDALDYPEAPQGQGVTEEEQEEEEAEEEDFVPTQR